MGPGPPRVTKGVPKRVEKGKGKKREKRKKRKRKGNKRRGQTRVMINQYNERGAIQGRI